MSNACVIQDVFAFMGNHASVLSDVNGRMLLPLILVAKLVLCMKRTDNNAERPVQLSNGVKGNLRSDRGAFRAESLCWL